MFKCVLCQKETCLIYNFCENCEFIKRVCNTYGSVEVKEILERVCLRNKAQMNFKITKELKDEIEKKKTTK
tara:strand:+ start:28 stop:240 length:213 start_codon:yes stop_codon:yes gene_type:complete